MEPVQVWMESFLAVAVAVAVAARMVVELLTVTDRARGQRRLRRRHLDSSPAAAPQRGWRVETGRSFQPSRYVRWLATRGIAKLSDGAGRRRPPACVRLELDRDRIRGLVLIPQKF